MSSRISRILKQTDPSVLFLAIAILIGGFIRLSQVLQSGFPINDGGLFYTMIKDLMANQYRLPVKTSYNHLNLPFAYPPLFLYLSGFLSDLTHSSLINIIRILPAIFTVLAIPAFYLLASAIIKDKDQVVFATFIFTFIPASFDWLIMGGGVTRSPAFFFSLLTLYFIYRLYARNSNWDVLWTTLFSSLTVLSHPETALHTAAGAVVFFLFFGRNKKGFLKSLIVAGLILIVTAPWWVTVLVQNGIAPFRAAMGTGYYNIGGIFQVLKFDLTDEYGLQTIGTLGLVGLFWHVAERKYFLPVWLLVNFISEPRSAPLYLSPCVAILASYSLIKILQVFNKSSLKHAAESTQPHPLSGKVSKGLFLLLSGQWIFSSMAITIILINSTTVTNLDSNAFDWIKLNTGDQSKFLVLTGYLPLSDPVSEWFPAITGRGSLATVQGVEWDGNSSFQGILAESIDFQQCSYETFQCIENWAAKNHKEFDYIYIRDPRLQAGAQNGSSFTSPLGDLSSSQGYTELVYKNDAVSIYKVK
jgi:hypothetical protein